MSTRPGGRPSWFWVEPAGGMGGALGHGPGVLSRGATGLLTSGLLGPGCSGSGGMSGSGVSKGIAITPSLGPGPHCSSRAAGTSWGWSTGPLGNMGTINVTSSFIRVLRFSVGLFLGTLGALGAFTLRRHGMYVPKTQVKSL